MDSISPQNNIQYHRQSHPATSNIANVIISPHLTNQSVAPRFAFGRRLSVNQATPPVSSGYIENVNLQYLYNFDYIFILLLFIFFIFAPFLEVLDLWSIQMQNTRDQQ